MSHGLRLRCFQADSARGVHFDSISDQNLSQLLSEEGHIEIFNTIARPNWQSVNVVLLVCRLQLPPSSLAVVPLQIPSAVCTANVTLNGMGTDTEGNMIAGLSIVLKNTADTTVLPPWDFQAYNILYNGLSLTWGLTNTVYKYVSRAIR